MSDYLNIIQDAQHKRKPLEAGRFVKISEREEKSDIPKEAWKPLLEKCYLQTWKGMILWKSVTEIGVYPMLLHELQPKTIIEIGAYTGGSAVWLADCLEIFKIDGTVYSIDIDISMVDEEAKNDSRIQFLEGDANNLASVLPPEKLSELPHPWLILEDTAMVEVVPMLEYVHKYGLKSGDYIIIEDTNKWLWELQKKDGKIKRKFKKEKRKCLN
jgi:cephalosporin hydroxylase